MRVKKDHTLFATPLLCTPLAFVWNMAMAYVVYWLCRLVFWAENYSAFPQFWSANSLKDIVTGAWMFDTSAILYTNVLYAFLMLIPLHWKERCWWQAAAKWVFIIVNSLAIIINLADAVYFQYTGRRTTTSVFQEFSNEGNLANIIGIELLRHWYLVLAGIAFITFLWKAYRLPSEDHGLQAIRPCSSGHKTMVFTSKAQGLYYYLLHLAIFAAYIPLTVIGMRGGATTAVRPITISNANQYVARPAETAIILNTPFALIRTIGKAKFITPAYYEDADEMAGIYTPIHSSLTDSTFIPKNVVVFIIESFGREYIGALNETLEDGHYAGYTPFVDELCHESATFRWSFCNGRKSIDGMPSILSSIPMFVEPFVLTPASMNTFGGLAQELNKHGYETAFFHGAENGSMGFQAFARKTGFQKYFGRDEFNADSRFRGDEDFDGMWAIWDEPFMQFYCAQLSELKEPFMTALFTATSHHPYQIPEAYRDTFPEEGLIIHKCIRYTDHALRRFFEEARKQPWFQNTLFVLTSDHTNLSDHAFYQTDIGGFCSPIIFYDPSGDLFQPGMRESVAQHIDIMPSVLGLLHHDTSYFAFGLDLFHTAADSTWAVNYNNGIYQYIKHGRLLQFDGEQTRAVYALGDSLLQENLVGREPRQPQMERELKAIIQQYMSRMNEDRLTP